MCNVCNTGTTQTTCNPCCCYNSCGCWLNSLFSNTQYVCRDACGNIRCGNSASTSNTERTGYGCYSASNTNGCGYNYGCGYGYNTTSQANANTQGYGCQRCRHCCND
ncbi:MAG: hypothetical protein J6A63_00455 [Clostridia bacterium]|nr:hypothetical protein [Clostridia bacterium]